MKRKIAIIADGWRRHITYVWIRGCRNYIKEHELDIEISVFHSFGNFSRDEKIQCRRIQYHPSAGFVTV